MLVLEPDALNDLMLTKARVRFHKGQKFGAEGHGWTRLKPGCPRTTVDEAIRRLTTAVWATHAMWLSLQRSRRLLKRGGAAEDIGQQHGAF